MAGELIQAAGEIMLTAGFTLGIIVTAAILVQIGAPLWLWLIYILEIIIITLGLVVQAVGEYL